MNHASFLHHIALALLLSIGGAATFFALETMLTTADALRLVLALVSGAYVAAILRGSPRRVGRLLSGLIWIGGAATLWLLDPSLGIYATGHAILISLLRSAHVHDGVLRGGVDVLLSLGALTAATWAAWQTSSLLAALWCFFLVQAAHVFLRATAPATAPNRFDRAFRAAESAARRLSSL